MLLQWCLALGLLLAAKGGSGVLAGEAQHPISESDHGIQTSSDCHNACTELVNILGSEKAYYNSIPDDFKDSFHCNRQREVAPACLVRPLTPKDVSAVVTTISKHNCHFAIKSGGHAMFEGASNADGGITIDLKHLDALELSEDGQTARVGPGQRWGRVYEFFEEKGKVVVGGRVSNVGVGGFLLGGGISFLGRKYGWASDNVRNYEIVLANGSISNVNYESHPDLYWALRGGAGNFGIVTAFDLEAYELGPVWGGNNAHVLSDTPARLTTLGIRLPFSFSLRYLTQSLCQLATQVATLLGRSTTSTAMIEALEDMTLNEKGDESYFQYFLAFSYFQTPGVVAANVLHVHSAQPAQPAPSTKPLAMLDLQAIGKPAYSTSSVRSMRSMVQEFDPYNVPGFRYLFHEITLRFNATVFQQIFDFFLEEIETVKDLPGMFPTIVMQPISEIVRVGNNKNGGNPFGFSGDDGPICVLSICPKWNRAEDDEAVKASVARFVEMTMVLLEKEGLLHRWVYPNYASEVQDVFAGYGEENRGKMKEIQRKYDPEGVFDRLQPGYFKV